MSKFHYHSLGAHIPSSVAAYFLFTLLREFTSRFSIILRSHGRRIFSGKHRGVLIQGRYCLPERGVQALGRRGRRASAPAHSAAAEGVPEILVDAGRILPLVLFSGLHLEALCVGVPFR
jgi:hypothetical protein